MKTALVRMLASLKFWTVIVGAVATASASLLARYGLELSDATVESIAKYLALGFGLLLAGQGAADFGKEAAKHKTPEPPSSSPGFARVHLLIVIALIGTLAACTWLRSSSSSVANAVVDCTKPAALSLVEQFGPMMDTLVTEATDTNGRVDWARVKSATKSFAVEAGGCVLATTIAKALAPKPPADPNAPQSSEMPRDLVDLRAGFASIQVETFGGRSFRTEHGTL